jgi:uncharacterized protein (DUF169 family)
MRCFEPVVGDGREEATQFFLDGHNRFLEDFKGLADGRNYASDFPRSQTGKYCGSVSAPLTATDFEPDLIMI